MSFLHPEFLYLMLPPAITLFFFLLTQKEQIADFFSEEVMAKLRVQTNHMTLQARNGLFMMMTLLLIVALAQPVIEEGKVKVEAKSADVMIALDISDSMLAEDIYPSRLKHAKQKIIELLEMTPKERMGVMAFAKETYLVAPLSFDHRAVSFLVRQLQPSFMTEKGTDITQLLATVGDMMKDREEKYLLLISDGGDKERFDEEITLAKKLGITVFVLGVGTEKGAPIKNRDGGFVKRNGAIMISHLNTAVAELATQTGGSYIVTVPGGEDLTAMLDEISVKATKRTLAEEEITQYIQLFYYPLGLAMILLLIATSSMSRRQRVEVPSIFILGLVMFLGTPSQAGLLDFQELDAAKEAYLAEDFNRSAKLYGKYARKTQHLEARYDQANALYKSGDYKGAADLYVKVDFKDETHRFNLLHNRGNALAKQGSIEALQEAVKVYEEALAIKEELPTRENLEAVKKRLQQESDKQQNENSDQEDDSKQKDQQQTRDEKDQKSSDKQKNETQDQQQKSVKPDKADDAKEEEKPSEQSEREKDDQKSAKKGDSTEPEKSDEAQLKQQKSAKPEDQKSEDSEDGESGKSADIKEEGMSDLEETKWLKMLNEQPASHIYRLTPMSNEKESTDANPW